MKIYISKPTTIGYEIFCLQKYLEVVQCLSTKLEEVTSLEEDQALLESMEGNMKIALVYRIERKKILGNQKELVMWLINILSLTKNLNKEALNGNFKNMYLQPMASEQKLLNTGKFSSSEGHFQYQYVRMLLKGYF